MLLDGLEQRRWAGWDSRRLVSGGTKFGCQKSVLFSFTMRRVEHPPRGAVLEEDCLTAVLSPWFMPYCKAKKNNYCSYYRLASLKSKEKSEERAIFIQL